MDILQDMRVFVRVVEAGSITAAANSMDATPGQTSRAVSDLEAHLRTRLLNRTTRRIAMTEAGERYYDHCMQILALIEQAEAEAGDAHARPCGKLRVRTPVGFGQHYLIKAIGAYQQLYPEVKVRLTLANGTPDFIEDGCDVAIVGALALSDSELISQKIGSAFSIVCASRTYIESHGVPHKPDDLEAHSYIHLNTPESPMNVWSFEGPNGEESIRLRPALLEVNTPEALVTGVREGLGIGLIPIYSAISGLRNGELAWVLPEYSSQEMGLYAMYLSRQYVDAKIRSWVDYLRDTMPAKLAADQEAASRFIHR
ncbi:LysR family transcriptional regulator [Paraburkholderia madseniana]|uniref:LysR family transcriptional regulator n=1 Tax=Paraburkholderia madseniana TaxID=2599607 RepID=A0AAP5BGZ9_9BURK|nr:MULTISPECIES: LysR family transcriptional regulator [Paraburkholderia]MCX4148532.1 LysR family transcriptional regulator [Paraburkholderia madseniana]MDN7151470.1 LysR family transcriptional regulator [Paraburkholderia sp. WS6]MDQ6410350.1 LysR family transcriptional regulator [Paraburkholderia madseniana]